MMTEYAFVCELLWVFVYSRNITYATICVCKFPVSLCLARFPFWTQRLKSFFEKLYNLPLDDEQMGRSLTFLEVQVQCDGPTIRWGLKDKVLAGMLNCKLCLFDTVELLLVAFGIALHTPIPCFPDRGTCIAPNTICTDLAGIVYGVCKTVCHRYKRVGIMTMVCKSDVTCLCISGVCNRGSIWVTVHT